MTPRVSFSTFTGILLTFYLFYDIITTKGGEDVKKEKITLGAIRQDLLIVADRQLDIQEDWRMAYIIPITLLAIALGILLKNIFVGLLIFSVAAYHIVRYVMACKEYNVNRNAVLSLAERGEFSIATEKLSHIAYETVYEPRAHVNRSGIEDLKTVTVYHFAGGSSWRVPNVYKHYSWSKECYLSSKGLDNISLEGDEFFFIRLQNRPDIAYIYPCKLFELDASLKKEIIWF